MSMLAPSATGPAVVTSRAPGAALFHVRPVPGGLWSIEAVSGLVQGCFRSRREAVRFAIFELGGRGNAVVLDAAGERMTP